MNVNKNITIFDASVKCADVLKQYNKILISVSGGSDSDTMLDLIIRTLQENPDINTEIHYVFFDTGIEYSATKKHLDELEERYNITIERVRAKLPVPAGCIKYGQPFLSKMVSQMIEFLQKRNFDFKNDGLKSYEELTQKYEKCTGALTWWCNKYPAKEGKQSYFNINSVRLLKEFMIENPPTFRISDKCCKGAKKETSKDYEKDGFDLKTLGLRWSEGGVRSLSAKNCFTKNEKSISLYRPVWWFTDKDKEEYKEYFDLKYSDCYEIYGFKRTGCCACPYNSNFEEDLIQVNKYEPNLFFAVNNIFKDSYAYTRAYREFKEQHKDLVKRRTKKEIKNGNNGNK